MFRSLLINWHRVLFVDIMGYSGDEGEFSEGILDFAIVSESQLMFYLHVHC